MDARQLGQLLDLAREADGVGSELDAAKKAYWREPSAENLERVRRASREALEREVAFRALWQRVSRGSFK
jgi:hypothetical protein